MDVTAPTRYGGVAASVVVDNLRVEYNSTIRDGVMRQWLKA